MADTAAPSSAQPSDRPSARGPVAADEVVDIAADLIRIDSSNYGDGSGPGERAAAEHVVGLLEEVGLAAELLESDPGRANVVLRLPGEDRSRDALVLHGHLDVVPARAADWSVDPFGGEVRDGCLWGRGAVDMKGMDAMILSVVRQMTREGRRPARDVVVAFTADEEAGSVKGAGFLVETRPDLFEGATEAVSEVGGFSLDVAGQRCYLVQTAEKGIAWVRLVAHGRAGHGSQVNDDNAVTRLAGAVARIGAHRWPLEIRPTVRAFLEGVEDITGEPLDPEDFDALTRVLGTTANWVGATLRNTSNPTQLEAGYKHNVIPGTATALVDCRTLPGQGEHVLDVVRELAGPGVDVEVVHQDTALETDLTGSLPDAMVAALLAEDPGARVLPYCLSGGTDNKALARLGIRGFGFAPLQLPADLDFAGMFHGVDERVPTEALRFGTRVLDRLLATC
ncbi:M20/M25/M40 family metallo-hydrolase [Pseudokineococcus lusitanus]|uniref:Acetylornithine deacetylase/succinyl-diaminopimelate desuccinylase-like protein n=1 Tax=Pseudokineococcus lusitanus TaxID=763993 RepID=A0A3N1HSW4_9ACTN|nr:M20/M25/M40 family metallo-hydrolase [Pseudokineococcus lusitanus]ROP45482.1 acetylornithine deacetylase/succinyl-diaminopimelate desuccinylase-like protein [Pseudokineococcus lusitanus]